MKPVIGVVPLVDTDKKSYWMLPGYMNGIMAAGGLPIMLPLSEESDNILQLVNFCDGFLFTGGHDVSPWLYGEDKLQECGECIPVRDRMEKILLEEILKENKPLLGICRGIQLINAVLGGTLYQDIPTQMATELEHHQKPPYDKPVHEVLIEAGSPLHDVLKKDRLMVNSYHHQGIKCLSPKLKVMAAAADGLAEAVYVPGKKFVWAVQWHPEFLYEKDMDSANIFKAFVGVC